MRVPPRRRICLPAVLAWLLLAPAGSAQSFIFVSPNTRDGMSAPCALDSLNSLEQRNFLAVARYLGSRICSKPQVRSAAGLNGPGAENSALVTGCHGESARYLGELLGRYAHQKWILVFDAAQNSAALHTNERLVILTWPGGEPLRVIQELRSHAIGFATLVMEEKAVRVYVWAKDSSQEAPLRTLAASESGAGVGAIQEIAGTGTLVGDDSRAAAQRVLDARIHSYERAHHRAFSRLLWSRKLRDMDLPDKDLADKP